MSTTRVIIIIVLVFGVVIGNITLLKYSARFKFPTPSKPYDDGEENNAAQPCAGKDGDNSDKPVK